MTGAVTAPESILFVDDEATTLRSVRRTLRSHGYEHVMTSSDSRGVMELLDDSFLCGLSLPRSLDTSLV